MYNQISEKVYLDSLEKIFRRTCKFHEVTDTTLLHFAQSETDNAVYFVGPS